MDESLRPIEEQIREYDARLVKCARALVEKADAGADWEALDAEVGFMDILQAHRRGVLAEYSRRGGKVKDLCAFGARVEGENAKER